MDEKAFVGKPLSATFLVVGVVGFIVVFYMMFNSMLDYTWGTLFLLVFTIFVLAVLKSLKIARARFVLPEVRVRRRTDRSKHSVKLAKRKVVSKRNVKKKVAKKSTIKVAKKKVAKKKVTRVKVSKKSKRKR